MSLIELLIFFLQGLISSRRIKELLRAAGNYMISHKHVEVGKLQAHNVLLAACIPWEDTLPLRVKAPGIQLPQNCTRRNYQNYHSWMLTYKTILL
ncbi:unnamed protein product [Timema podura]|uniref:Uncharacterized protein n=1 Tax=Timema podura TaxID=61482 RepID=A0ABN7PM40_TIMPD|nr:unnamed protein product [Timema podura]